MFWRTRHKWSSLLLAFFVPIFILVQQPYSRGSEAKLTTEQMVALSTKPAVVRIENACAASFKYEYENDDKSKGSIEEYVTYGGPGSGFFVNPSGYIVTYSVKSLTGCTEELRDKAASLVEEKLGEVEKDKIEMGSVDYIHNVYLPQPDGSSQQEFEVEKSGESLGGRDISLIRVPVKNAPVLKLANGAVQLQDKVSVIGYPIAADSVSVDAKNDFVNENKGLSEKAFSEASITSGSVSNPNKTLEDKSPVLQVDVQSGPGSAGSPIINSNGEVIGIIASTNRDKNFYADDNSSSERGVPIAIPASTIQDFIQSTGVKNEQGRTDFLFRDGLTAFAQGDYQGAKTKFEAVKDLFSNHSEVDRLISQSNELLVDQVKEPPYLFYGVIAAVVLGLLGLILFLLRRKPSSAKRMPTGAVPLSSQPSPGRNNGSTIVDYSQPYLELEFQGKSCYLTLKGDEHRIGRDASWSDVEIPENWEVISRHHAILRKEENGYRIYDGDGITPSSNGLLRKDNTKVDMKGHLLRNGEEFRIGKNAREQVLVTYFDPASSRADVRPTRMAD